MRSRRPLILQVLIRLIASSAFVLVTLSRGVCVTDTAGGGVVGVKRPISWRALGVGWLSGSAALLVHEVLERVIGKQNITTV